MYNREDVIGADVEGKYIASPTADDVANSNNGLSSSRNAADYSDGDCSDHHDDANEHAGLLDKESMGCGAKMSAAVRKHWQLLLWCPMCVAANVGQTVTLAIANQTMPSFSYWIFWSTAIAFLIIFAIGYAIHRVLHKGTTPYITDEVRAVPWRFYAIVGLLTTLNGIFLLFSNSHVPGVLQALLGPTVVTIPMCMGFSIIFLRSRYTLLQVGAVMIIIGGVLLAAADTLSGSQKKHDKAYWTFLFFCGSIPAALMSVYEERTLSVVTSMPLPYMMACATIFQVLSILALATPLSVVPGFGPVHGGFSQLIPTQKAATKCFLNMYPAGNTTGGFAVIEEGTNLCPDCRCDIAGPWVWAFTIAYILANYSNVAVVKHGGATLMYVVSTLVTPLSAFCFSADWIVGAAFVEKLSSYNYSAIAVLLVGVTSYRVATMTAERREKNGEIDAASPTAEKDALAVSIPQSPLPTHHTPSPADHLC